MSRKRELLELFASIDQRSLTLRAGALLAARTHFCAAATRCEKHAANYFFLVKLAASQI